MKKKIIIIGLVFLVVSAVVLIILFAGGESAPPTGITIRCALIGYGDYEALYNKSIPEFERQTGHKVEIVYLDNHFELDKKLKSDFATGSEYYDVISNHSSFYTQYIDYLEPLNDYFSQNELKDFLPRILNSGKQGNRLFLIPRHADVSLLNYRTDIFNDETLKTKYLSEFGVALFPPKTWDEFEQQAIFFSQNTDLYGTQFAGREEALTGRFYEILYTHGGKFIDETGRAAFNSKNGQKSAEMFRNLYKNNAIPKDTLSYLWDDLAKNFANGDVVMYMEWHSYTNYLRDSERSLVADKYDFVRLPVGDSGMHAGWTGTHGFSLTRSGKNKQAASELIRFLTNPQNQYEECLIGYLPVRTSVWDKLLIKVKSDNNELEERRLNLARQQFALDSYTPPLIPQWISASDIVFPVLQQIILGQADTQQGLNNAAKQVDLLFE